MRIATVFFRDDDVYKLDKSFVNFHNAVKGYGVPFTYAVIPGRLRRSMRKFLVSEMDGNPGMFEVVQHGWKHRNYGTGKTYEFGPSRSFSEQIRDMEKGMRKMEKAFGDRFTRIFVPPFHGFDDNTTKAAAELGFRALSVGYSKASDVHGISTLNVKIKIGEGAGRKAVNMFYNSIKKERIVGVLAHHRTLQANGRDDFDLMLRVSMDMAKGGIIRMGSMGSVLKEIGA
jgi:hypothetical protein